MPRKRMIDPEFWSDEEIGKWSFAARLFYIGLWNFADDEGRFKAHDSLLKAQIFPYDKNIKIGGLKREIGSKIVWYKVNECQYGYIHNFLRYQVINRPTPSKLPSPDNGKTQISDGSVSGHGGLTPKLIEVNRSKGHTDMSEFNRIWERYPVKVKRKEAERHFLASVRTPQDLADIGTALNNYLGSKRVKEGYVQNGGTWFNNWRDWLNYKEQKRKQVRYE